MAGKRQDWMNQAFFVLYQVGKGTLSREQVQEDSNVPQDRVQAVQSLHLTKQIHSNLQRYLQ